MIQANEIRIGNLIHSKLTNVDFYVTGENLYDISNEPNNVESILITEEHLIEFGFKLVDKGFYSIKTSEEGITLEINIKLKRCILFEKTGFLPILYPKYLHRLQNLYFVLTGKELEYEQKA